MSSDPTPTIRPATDADLPALERWLAEELEATGEGFHKNWNIIERGVAEGDTFVMMRDAQPVAVLVQDTAGPAILSVRPDLRGHGLGTAFVRWAIEWALEHDYCVIEGLCQPRTSIPFWQQQGFSMGSTLGATVGGDNHAHRVLERQLAHEPGPPVRVELTLFPEARNWDKTTQQHWARSLTGYRQSDGSVRFPSRVVLYTPVSAALPDCVVRIVVDGQCVYEDKLKRREACTVGIEKPRGVGYYLDCIEAVALETK